MFAMKDAREQTRHFASWSKKRQGNSDVAHETMTSPSQFLQRYLGNGYLQSPVWSGVPTIQRKCSCGGSCASCGGKEDETRKLQTKLTVGPANDVYEQEADRVAEAVVRMPDSSVQTEGEQPNTDIKIQRITAGDSNRQKVAPDIDLDQSDGQPLPPATRQFMERRFGVEFGHVRLHTDSHANQTAAQIQARAFTYGHHIWLGKGESEQNKHLMAHELTHVVQQGAASSPDQASSTGASKDLSVPQVQRARLPCTTRTTIDVFGVNIGGGTRTLFDDLATANSVLCQCGIELNATGAVSDPTDVLNLDAPLGELNGSGGTPSRELSDMLTIRPGGDVIHAYYVPAIEGSLRGEAVGSSRFSPSLPDSVIVSERDTVVDTFVHELGHVLLNSGSHHGIADNLMAAGTRRNVGVDELEEPQCGRMP